MQQPSYLSNPAWRSSRLSEGNALSYTKTTTSPSYGERLSTAASNSYYSKTYSYQNTSAWPTMSTYTPGKYSQYARTTTQEQDIPQNTRPSYQTPIEIPKLYTKLAQPDPLRTKSPIKYNISKPIISENRYFDVSENDRGEEYKQDALVIYRNKSQEFEEWLCEETERPNKKDDKVEISTEDSITLFSARNFNPRSSVQASDLNTHRDKMLMGSFVDTPKHVYVFQINSNPRLW
mgnify:CR=1 FL=1